MLLLKYTEGVKGREGVKWNWDLPFSALGEWDSLHWDWDLTTVNGMNNFESRKGIVLFLALSDPIACAHQVSYGSWKRNQWWLRGYFIKQVFEVIGNDGKIASRGKELKEQHQRSVFISRFRGEHEFRIIPDDKCGEPTCSDSFYEGNIYCLRIAQIFG